jgi:hypothetical protein
MSGFICHALQPEQAATVFPLVREALPGLDLKAWLRFARRLLQLQRSGQGGIVVAQRKPRTHPCGVFTWRREHDLTHGEVLVAEHFIAVDLLDPNPVMAVLVAELDLLAGRLGCTAIRTVVPGEGALAGTKLRAAGHRTQGATLWKTVSRADAMSPRCRH